jgi:hypothetical protein
MNLEAILLEPSSVSMRTGILVACVLTTLLVGYLNTLTGLSYKFHVFFILPLLIVSWFSGKRFGYGMAVLAALEWFIADRSLTGDQTYALPLVFNTATRLAIFLFGAWLICEIRRVLLQPNISADAASNYVEKLRDRLSTTTKEKAWPVTFSIGVTSHRVAPKDFETLVKQADTLMYEAKCGGRDRILQREFW